MVIEKARELGLALSESVEFKRLNDARTAIDADNALTDMIDSFTNKRQEVIEALSDEDADRALLSAASREMERLQAILLENSLFKEMLDAQNDFQSLMSRVNSEIAACIGMEGGDNEGCGGSCATCGGCKH
ncbi:MAG: YlbF family regulator [Clostridiaceae bacterium]|nr:YlbF family regulator [Eubacteriales bacterium]